MVATPSRRRQAVTKWEQSCDHLVVTCSVVEVHGDGDLADRLEPDLGHLIGGGFGPLELALAGI
jgi:hypothetical protein